MYVRLVDENDDLLHNSVPEELSKLCNQCFSENETFINNGVKYRHGKICRAGYGCAYIITNDHKIVRRSRSFKEKLSVYFDFIEDISRIKKRAYTKANAHTRRLVHSLDSLSAHNIQEIYNLIPESELRNQQKEDRKQFIQNEVKKQIKRVHKTILNLIKMNEAMKMEFAMFNRLTEGVSQKSDRQRHKIYQAFMSVAHTFFQDFADRDIFLNIGDSEIEVVMDYELFQVAVYQILDNATKYARKSSNIDVVFIRNENNVHIDIYMSSLLIEADEVDKVTQDGFCGRHAKQAGKNGKGIGMFMVRKAMNLNEGQMIIKANVSASESIRFNDKEYNDNKFTLIFESA